MLAERSRDIQEMAILLTEKKNPTRGEVASMKGIATQVVDGIEYALKMARGEVPLKDFEGHIKQLQAEAEIIRAEDAKGSRHEKA